MRLLNRILFVFWQLWVILAAVIAQYYSDHARPSVTLDQASVTGITDGLVESFLGIPYAEPPVENLRLQLPRLIDSDNGTLEASAFGNQCFQQTAEALGNLPPEVLQGLGLLLELLSQVTNVTESEDSNVSADAKLPVLFWIYGGGFTDGSNALTAYNGTVIPVIYVALNYRLNAFGFLGGNEIKEAGLGNIGLQDQRTALRWVHKFISAFGGDPYKVTIWGESAGSISVFFHLYANGGDTEGLFRAIMSSGTSLPTADITEAQDTYDFVVDRVGCSNASDTLACLRTVPADNLLAAANDTLIIGGFTGLSSPFLPQADGVFITMPPMQLPLKAKIADVPFVVGDTKDEGTFFSFGSLNITTDGEFASYVSQILFPGSSPADLGALLRLYPSDPAAGSPFDTGSANAFSPQYKRIAAVQGDWFFHGPRRQLLDKVSAKRGVYNFLSARGNLTGVAEVIALRGGDMADYFIRFVNHLDPNAPTGVQWPQYKPDARSTLQFNDGSVPLNVTVDDQRLAGIEELTSLALRFPL
ncbi:alpha beta-hydrolase [Cerioporus squamosus]|nr:alpha beta-hydrolase [Cerioporus squamosus]